MIYYFLFFRTLIFNKNIEKEKSIERTWVLIMNFCPLIYDFQSEIISPIGFLSCFDSTPMQIKYNNRTKEPGHKLGLLLQRRRKKEKFLYWSGLMFCLFSSHHFSSFSITIRHSFLCKIMTFNNRDSCNCLSPNGRIRLSFLHRFFAFSRAFCIVPRSRRRNIVYPCFPVGPQTLPHHSVL